LGTTLPLLLFFCEVASYFLLSVLSGGNGKSKERITLDDFTEILMNLLDV
jgi:hypothetical protein